MNKKDLLKIAVVLVVLFFLGQMFYTGYRTGAFNFGKSKQTDTVDGTVLFNGTIRTYNPFLFVATSNQNLDFLKNDGRVKNIAPVSQGWLINITLRDDVYPIAQELRGRNITSTAVANIATPSKLTLTLANGSTLETFYGGSVVQIAMEPIVDTDSEIEISMVARAQGTQLLGYLSAQVNQKPIQLKSNATTTKKHTMQIFIVPWDIRNKVNNVTGTIKYEQQDGISFSRELNAEEIIRYKNLSYITFISQYSASVSENYTDKTQIISDFTGINITFPNSRLYVESNESIDLGYNKTTNYDYRIKLPNKIGNYEIKTTKEYTVETDKELPTLQEVDIAGIAIGDNIFSITSVKVS